MSVSVVTRWAGYVGWRGFGDEENLAHGRHVKGGRGVPNERRRMEASREPMERVDTICGDPGDDSGDLEPGVAGLVVFWADRRGHRVAVAEPPCLRAGGIANELGGKRNIWGEAVAEGA